MRRVVIFGAPGSGKSTLARRLSARTGLPWVERDRLGILGSDPYRRAVSDVVAEDEWIFDGAPYYVDDEVYPRADTVIIFDFAKPVVMRRVLTRSLRLLLPSRTAGAHRAAGLRSWLTADHPVRVAWTSHAARRREAADLLTRDDLHGTTVIRFRTPRDVDLWWRGLNPGCP